MFVAQASEECSRFFEHAQCGRELSGTFGFEQPTKNVLVSFRLCGGDSLLARITTSTYPLKDRQYTVGRNATDFRHSTGAALIAGRLKAFTCRGELAMKHFVSETTSIPQQLALLLAQVRLMMCDDCVNDLGESGADWLVGNGSNRSSPKPHP